MFGRLAFSMLANVSVVQEPLETFRIIYNKAAWFALNELGYIFSHHSGAFQPAQNLDQTQSTLVHLKTGATVHSQGGLRGESKADQVVLIGCGPKYVHNG